MEHPDRTKQFDVPYVDGALLSILVPRVHGYLRDCSVHLPFLQQLPAAVSSLIPSVLLDDADINGLIQLSLSAIMAFVTIGRGVGTPGMNSLGLRIQQHQQHPAHASTRDPRIDRLRRVAAYVVLSGLLPTLYRMARKRWEDDRDERMNGDDNISYGLQDRQSTGASRVEILARHRRRKLRDGVMKFVAFVVPPARLVNHLCFVLGGSSTGSINSSSHWSINNNPTYSTHANCRYVICNREARISAYQLRIRIPTSTLRADVCYCADYGAISTAAGCRARFGCKCSY